MNVKKRAWVKNVTIIFLVVLLILTFASKTILNRSLPEVTGQTAYSGEISTAVRGKGTVTANEAFSVSVETSREITRINARVGDVVEAGFVLFELDPADSTDLDAAIKLLEEMQYNYNYKILSLSKDYALEDLQYALEDAMEAEEKSILALAVLDAAKLADAEAQEILRLATEEIDLIQEKIDELTAEINAGIDEDLLTGDMKDKKHALEQAQRNYELAKKAYEDAQSAPVDLTPYHQAVANAAAAVGTALVAAQAEMNATYLADYDDPAIGANPPTIGTPQYAFDQFHTEVLKGTAANATLVNNLLTTLLNLPVHNDAANFPAVAGWRAAVQAHRNAQINLDYAQSQANDTTALKAAVENAARAVENAQKAWDDATTGIRVEAKLAREQLRNLLKTKNTALEPIKKAADETAKALTAAEKEVTITPEEAAEAIKLAQRAIERKTEEVASSDALKNLELGRDREAIADQQTEVTRLRNKELGTNVTTRYGGTILSIDVMVGDKTVPGNPLATIEVNGKGYTLEFSVSNEEVSRVRIGDIASISSWGRSDTVCTLAAIRTDRDNPTRRKILEFDVTGDYVVAGENLELSLGSRTQYYNFVVPNSAIREDADGKFVLIADQKQSPLGVRYIATRYEVTVVDYDTKNSAITGDFEWSPFVITTSSKPIEPNTQVRLA